MKKIALSSCFMYPDPSRAVFGHKTLSYMENDMVNFLAAKDLQPILIPDLDDKFLDHYMDEVQGLVLQGGADLSPLSYNEEYLDKDKWPGDRHRDLYEFKLIKIALEKKIPIFGICRGFQVLNAYFGGTLYQDLKTQTKIQFEHRCADKYDHVNHQISLTSGGVLHKKYKKDNLTVNSVHHQGIKTLAPTLKEEARDPENLIVEAFTNKKMEDQFILAVQWHPEFNHTLKEKVDSSDSLIELFIQAMEK